MVNHHNQSNWVIIIKSHAVKEGIDKIIIDFLEHKEDNKFIKRISLKEKTKKELFNLFIDDIREINISPDSDFFDLVYPQNIKKEYFSLLKKLYSWKSIWLTLSYKGTQDELQEILKDLKGQTRLLDHSGNIIREWFWLRGLLLSPRKYIKKEILETLSIPEFEEVMQNMLNNILHTSDNQQEYYNILHYIKHLNL